MDKSVVLSAEIFKIQAIFRLKMLSDMQNNFKRYILDI